MKDNTVKKEYDSGIYYVECEALVDSIVEDIERNGKLRLGRYLLMSPDLLVDEAVKVTAGVFDISKSILIEVGGPKCIKRILASKNGEDWYNESELLKILVLYKNS
ncbi:MULTISPECIES: hypothetical protein [Stenotrophomonas]|uniref:hypothetical protein n=1 Tax=Stenotrophomonas maltophilia TaxID=40324 RepID=UPI00116004E2|nr:MULTISPECIES: hypothetical protein [Stenotrophomonas]